MATIKLSLLISFFLLHIDKLGLDADPEISRVKISFLKPENEIEFFGRRHIVISLAAGHQLIEFESKICILRKHAKALGTL